MEKYLINFIVIFLIVINKKFLKILLIKEIKSLFN